MWRRLTSQLRPLSSLRSTTKSHGFAPAPSPIAASSSSLPSLRPSVVPVSRHFATESEKTVTHKTVEDVMPIATGHERQEIEAALEGRDLLEINYPEGPFGTKEEPAVVRSYYDKRIVGCPGGEGEDEHDVVWFWLEKGKSHECPVCTQYFVLEVVGPGGPPDGHGDDDEDEHDHIEGSK